MGLDQYFHLGAGTSPYLPLGYFNDFPGPPFTSVVATEEVSTKVTRSPAIPNIVPTVKTPRINAYAVNTGQWSARDAASCRLMATVCGLVTASGGTTKLHSSAHAPSQRGEMFSL